MTRIRRGAVRASLGCMNPDTFAFIALELVAVLGLALFLGTIALFAERNPEL